MYDGQSLAVQLAPDRVAFENNGVDLDSDVFRIHGLTAAYVVVPALLIEGHTVTVDVAWVATGTPRRAVETLEDHPEWSFVGKDVGPT